MSLSIFLIESVPIDQMIGDDSFQFTTGSPADSGHRLWLPATVSLVTTTESLLADEAVPTVTVADGASVEIGGVSAQSVIFTGTTGTLKIDHSLAYNGKITGLTGSDGLDLSDVRYGTNTTAAFLGDASGGTLTVTDGTHTANIALVGNYLSSGWTLSSDGSRRYYSSSIRCLRATGKPSKLVPAASLPALILLPDDTMVVRTDTYGAYIWNGTQWQQLVTSTSMPAAFSVESGGGSRRL